MKHIIFVAIVVLPFLIAVVFSILKMKKQARYRKSPISSKLLRAPGQSLRAEVEANWEKIEDSFFILLLIFFPPFLLLSLFVHLNNLIPWWQIGIVLFLYLFLIGWGTRRLSRLLDQRFKLLVGLDAEQAVGQELNQLMLSGYHIYHDFPAEKFNIDHVVVGASGVYAVETKGRTKPKDKKGKADHNVIFDGQKLQFSGWIETAPLDQAKRQAEWLSKWLSKATGTSVRVQGVLVFPGWYVKRQGKGPVWVMSGKEVYSLKNGCHECSQQLIQQVAHQLEQKCRDVGPTVYGDKEVK